MLKTGKLSFKFSFRYLFLILFIMTVFGFGSGRFIFVKAFSGQINIVPGSFKFENEADKISDSTWVFGGVTAVAATVLGAYWYYRKKGVKSTINTGFHLGLVMVVVRFVLDWLAFLPLILSDQQGMKLINAYYGNPRFWIIIVLVVGSAALTGKYYERLTASGKKPK